MRDKTLVISALLIAMMLSMSVLSVSAWYFAADGSENDTFNAWGPRIDRLLIKKYTSIEAVAAALQGGEIDITDWALTPALVATLSTDPNVVLKSYGGESGYFTISLNWNNEQFLGNPPDPAYANPVYPNPMSVLAFRQASTHLVDRNYLCNVLAGGAYAPMFTPIPPYMAGYVHPQINYAGTLAALAYPPSIPDAAALLTANGFPVNGGTGKRYWDINGNGVDDGGSEDFSLIFLSRSDLLRKSAADLLAAGYDALGVPYVRSEVTGGQAAVIAMTDKNYHIYTAGWSGIGPDPDFMYDLYHSTSYWHPGQAINYGDINDPILDANLEAIKYAATDPAAVTAAYAAQATFCADASEIPLGATTSPKAFAKYYSGGNGGVVVGPDDGENQYRRVGGVSGGARLAWTHVVDQKGLGENSFYTTEDAWPVNTATGLGFPWGDGTHMTMRYGWKEAAYPQLVNPLYSNWYWDWEAMGRMYDSMAGRNPYTLAGFEVDFLAHDWTVGTYVDPDDGLTKSMVNVQLRTDIFWSDGVPMDANDVAYTFVGLSADLALKNATKVWWQPTIDQMKSFEMINPYTVTIKMKVLSTFAIGWVLGNIIVPKHAIQPFVTNPGTTALDISANWFPDHPELLVCTGPMVLVSNDATTTLLTRNPYCYNRSHPADLNYDHTIDIFDVVRVALAFGSVPGDPNWDPKADINYDNIVDIFDLATVAVSFGWIGY